MIIKSSDDYAGCDAGGTATVGLQLPDYFAYYLYIPYVLYGVWGVSKVKREERAEKEGPRPSRRSYSNSQFHIQMQNKFKKIEQQKEASDVDKTERKTETWCHRIKNENNPGRNYASTQ